MSHRSQHHELIRRFYEYMDYTLYSSIELDDMVLVLVKYSHHDAWPQFKGFRLCGLENCNTCHNPGPSGMAGVEYNHSMSPLSFEQIMKLDNPRFAYWAANAMNKYAPNHVTSAMRPYISTPAETAREGVVKFFYMHDDKERRHVVVARKILYSNGKSCRVRAAVAVCHPTDKYDKKLGRKKAEGRLESEEATEFWASLDNEYGTIVQQLLNHLRHCEQLPRCVREMAFKEKYDTQSV